MKIAIIDDESTGVLEPMKQCLENLGHTVLAVCVSIFGSRSGEDVSVEEGIHFTNVLPAITALLEDFNPDMMLVDHDFNIGPELTGETVIHALRPQIAQGKRVCISTMPRPYCDRQFPGDSKYGSRSRDGLVSLLEKYR